GFQPVRREPAVAVPLSDRIAHLAIADAEWQQALRGDGIAQRLVGDDRRRTAELAAVGDLAVDKYRDRMATLALHLAWLRAVTPLRRRSAGHALQQAEYTAWRCIGTRQWGRRGSLLFLHLRQGFQQVELDHPGTAITGARHRAGQRHDGAAVRTGQRLLGRTPLQIPATFRAGMLADGDLAHQPCKNASSAERAMRVALPILRAFRSPAAMAAITSSTETDSACAACSGVSTSSAEAASATGNGGGAAAGAAGALPCMPRIISWAMPKPTAICAGTAAAAAPSPPSPMPWPIWYLT